MAGATRSTISAMLKEDYGPRIVDQFSKKKLIMKLLRRNRKDFGGDGAYIPLMTQRSHSHGARAESGTLPTAGNVSMKETTIQAKFNYAKIMVTGPSRAVARKDKYAFARTLKLEIMSAVESFSDDFCRQLYGDGSGVVATCGTTSSSNTVVVGDTRNLREGQQIDIRVINGGADVVTNRTVDAILSDTTFTISGATVSTTATSHGVFIKDNATTAGAVHEIMGIQGIINDQNPDDIKTSSAPASLQGLDVATYPFWKASRLHNSGVNRDLSLELLHDLLIDVDKKSGTGDGLSAMITTHEIWKRYGLLVTPDRRYTGSPNVFDGGWKFLEFDGLKIFFDKMCPANTIFLPNFDHLTLYEESDIRWSEEDGSLLKFEGSTDAYIAFLVYYSNLGTDYRRAHGVLEDISH